MRQFSSALSVCCTPVSMWSGSMSFISPEFAFVALLFFPLFWCLHASRNAQLWLLTAASYLLYASWSPVAALVLFVYSLFIWLMANLLNAMTPRWKPRARARTLALAISVLLGLSLLLLTKYYEFLRQLLVDLLPGMGFVSLLPVLDLVVPAGISFFTFQAITFLVWRSREPRQALPLLKLLAFLSFWPTLFAGPILRAPDFFRQIEYNGFGLPRDVARAIYLILLGLSQKLVFSSWLADHFVDAAFRYPETLDVLGAAAAAWGYALQIFLDFSGYSLIVTGLALLLGYPLPINFRQPYLAQNLREFWRGWHITLSTFIRDYIYIPLGGSRLGSVRMQVNIMIAMLLSGIWHGANTTFLVWGGLHGAGVVLLNIFERRGLGVRMPKPLAIALTLLYVSLAWVFFRANTCEQAWLLLQRLAVAPQSFNPQLILLVVFSVLFFELSAWAAELEAWTVGFIERIRGWRLVAATSALSFCAIQFGPSGIPGFLYYRF